MCGIAGFIDFNHNSTQNNLISMTDALSHRGPDGADYKIWKSSDSIVGYGHRRLAIIDLSESGAQPMQKHNYTITYNGEIYNFKEVRKELINLGYHFFSDSDTEVVLSAYHEWGMNCLHKFRGMFAFSLFDHSKNKVIFCLDRLGIKPLYLYEKDGLILFGSELKAFHKHPNFKKEVNNDAVHYYFKYGFVPNPLCIFKNVEKVKPGHYISYKLEAGSREEKEYWNASSFVYSDTNKSISEAQLEQEIEELLLKSFEYRMVSDVPVGVFLSGGYDSSLVTAMIQSNKTEKINTFTIGFENEDYNEAKYANQVAKYLGTNHYSHICTKEETQNIIPEIPVFYDEPFADSSAIPTFLVSKITSQSVKVALSSDGGDELFSGYSRNLSFRNIYKKANTIPQPLRKLLAKSAGFMEKLRSDDLDKSLWWSKSSQILNDPTLLNIFDIYPQFLSNYFISKITMSNGSLAPNPQHFIKAELENVQDQFNALLSFDYQSTLTNDMLVKVDRASMANSLEGREPMLDHYLYEYMAKIPSSLKMKDGNLKYLLKKITHKYIPSKIMDREKMGFGIPINNWLQTDLKFLIQEYFSEDVIKKHGILNPEATTKIVSHLMNSTTNVNNQLWLLLSFQMWCEKWL